MRWHQTLFWKIFGAVWLVSMVGIVISLSLYLALADPDDRREDQIERATLLAERIVSSHEHFEEPRLGRGRHMPIWVFEADGDLVYGSERRPPPNALRIPVESDSGQRYMAVLQLIPEDFAFDRLVGFVLSIQAIWVLAVSFVSSLFLAWLVVRPINALRRHVRALYDDQNLSHRAEGRLSRRTDELGELAREFNQMADYVEKTLGSQEHLLRDVSHELRAPLARLRAALGLAEQRWGEDEKVIQRLSRECDQLEKLITEILALSRDESPGRAEQVDLYQLANALIDDARLVDQNHELKLMCKVKPHQISVSDEPLSRIVTNLLNNALSHTPEGTTISFKVESIGSRLNIEVSDTGPGVDEILLKELGQPFKRSLNSKGYGLGLSICKKAAERVGGSLHFSNAPQGGFVVKLNLPQSF